MAFPSVADSSNGAITGNTTDWPVIYPTTLSAGNLLFFGAATDGNSVTFSGFDSGWETGIELSDGNCSLVVYLKVAVGTESGQIGSGGGTVTASASEQGVWRVSAIEDWWGTIATGVEFSTGVTGSGTTPDPDELIVSWGADDALWRALTAADGGNTDVSAYPTNYSLNQFYDQSVGGPGAMFGAAGRNYNTDDTQDPGTFTLDASVGWCACTVAIRPAAPPAPPKSKGKVLRNRGYKGMATRSGFGRVRGGRR